MNDSTRIEHAVREALHDAADHASLATPVPLTDEATRVTGTRPSRRPRLLVAGCATAAAVALVFAGVVVAHEDGGDVRVSSPPPGSRDVPAADLARADESLQIYLNVKATDDQIAAVRTELDASPDVVRYAYLDQDAAYHEFAQRFACNSDLVHSIQPQDLPASFRVLTTGADATARLTARSSAMPGVESVDSPTADPTTSTANGGVGWCSFDPRADGQVDPAAPAPTTVPPTLPAAGEQPADTTSAHDAVVAAFTQAWDGTSTVEQRRAEMQDSDDLAATLDQARVGNESTIATMRAVIGDITFVAPDRAAVVFHLEFDTMTYPDSVGDAVLDGGVWKVSRETVCAVLSQAAAVSCPAG